MDSKFVMPGDEVAVEEEYAAGEGTFAEDGTVFASQVGVLSLDDDSCTATVKASNPPNTLKKGDIVYAVVADIRKTMATADVVAKEGSDRCVGGETYATLHVSKISPKYTDEVDKELRKGDYIRAVVTETKPSLQLATKDPHLGCIRALCSKCKTEMVRSRDGNGLYCTECRYAMPRKLADDYGDVRLRSVPAPVVGVERGARVDLVLVVDHVHGDAVDVLRLDAGDVEEVVPHRDLDVAGLRLLHLGRHEGRPHAGGADAEVVPLRRDHPFDVLVDLNLHAPVILDSVYYYVGRGFACLWNPRPGRPTPPRVCPSRASRLCPGTPPCGRARRRPRGRSPSV